MLQREDTRQLRQSLENCELCKPSRKFLEISDLFKILVKNANAAGFHKTYVCRAAANKDGMQS